MRTLQLLNWNLRDIEEYLDKVKLTGFDTIQINPMQPFKMEKDFHWWSSYQPLDFKVGNMFGTKDDLKHLCEEAKKRGINIVVDVVCNHVANNGGTLEEKLTPSTQVADRIRKHPEYFKKHNKLITNDDWYDVIHESIGLPGLNLSNPEMQKIVFDYLKELKECGVAGFRIDAAKHIGLPSDGCDFFKKLAIFLGKNNLFAYGEFLGTNKDKMNEMAAYINVLTDHPELIKNKRKAVAMPETHDDVLNVRGNVSGDYGLVFDKYDELTTEYNNTILYMRDYFQPYFPFGRKLNIDKPKRHNYSWIDMVLGDNDLRIYNDQVAIEEKIDVKISEESHHNLCEYSHEQILSNIEKVKTLEEAIILVLKDYKFQKIINKVLYDYDSEGYDDYLMKIVMHALYRKYSDVGILKGISYEDFFIMILQRYQSYFNGTKDAPGGDDLDDMDCTILGLKKK